MARDLLPEQRVEDDSGCGDCNGSAVVSTAAVTRKCLLQKLVWLKSITPGITADILVICIEKAFVGWEEQMDGSEAHETTHKLAATSPTSCHSLENEVQPKSQGYTSHADRGAT